MKICNSIIETIGNTPLIKIQKMNTGKAIIYVKMESFNPLSSVKDRVALALIEDGEERGKITKDTVLIEPTSGNTGIGLAFIAAAKGYRLILTMPETMSLERRKLLSALGAELVLTEGIKGMAGAIAKAHELASNTENSFIPNQFENKANPAVHKKTTAPEIWNDSDGTVDVFVAGVGTGGTITGVGEFLKEKKSSIRIIAVEPVSSAVISGKAAGPHKLQGIGAGFIPSILNRSIIDEIYLSDEVKAGTIARRAAKEEGLLIGISSGAALEAALHLSQLKEYEGKTIVALLPDSGERYLSTWLFE